MAMIFLTGYMGSGKSTAGRKLASRLNLEFIDLDKMIEAETGQSIAELFESKGEHEFRSLEHNALQKLINENKDRVISCGGGTPCYYGNMELMNRNGITIYIKMSADMLASRLSKSKEKRPLIEGKTQDELRTFITQHLEKREDVYHQAQYIVKGKDLDVEQVVDFIKGI